MKIIEVDPSIRKNVEANDGYCPCAIWQTPDTKCMCKEFREQKEPGLCHCGRFEKREQPMERRKRLIDVNDAIRKLEDEISMYEPVSKDDGPIDAYKKRVIPKLLRNVIDWLKNQPIVDAVEVVHGRWVLLAEFFDGSICTECSVCGEEYTYKKGRLEHVRVEYAKYNYCPNCGAKMDGEPCNNY